MKIKDEKKKSCMKLLHMALVSCLLVACNNDDIDNVYSRNNSIIAITASSDYVVLNENTPDEVALTIQWTPATDYGNDFITTYQYQVELVSSKADAIQEYEDGGIFRRSYTHKQLQDMLLEDFYQLTSTKGEMKFTINASFEGPRLVVPDMASVAVKVKTYGAKQFLADEVFMAGTAVGESDVKLSASSSNTSMYVYNGKLSVGKIHFPLLYGDEENSISPESADAAITSEAMSAIVMDRKDTHSWVIPEEDNYRVTINFSNKTVTIMPAGDIIEVDKIYLAGTAIEGEDMEVTQTLENENIYAFRGELKAGRLYLPILFNEMKALSIVPLGNNHEVSDGGAMNFAQASTEASVGSKYWEIPEAGTYRIVVDVDLKTITIYSSATDLQSKEVTWNNTVEGINPFTSKVDKLWMYGTFNGYEHDSGVFNGFQDKYSLTQSLANPHVFVYKGDVLPRSAAKDDRGNSITGSVRFCVSNINNNVYAYGSTADAKRNDHNGYITVASNASQGLVEGQGDNRYAYFLIPENINYVLVDIENLTVVFDHK